ncbi:MAG: CPBP family intramembrane metalloprotease [Clostridia bacterium]|nr:CPBP family intramembrane metalloprotease [Clostridia bacterium]
MKAKEFFKNISPFNNREDMSKALYIIKKMLAFFLIYVLFVGIGEVIVIGITMAMGYDPLHGVLPSVDVVMLMKYYGFIVFFVVTLLYCKLFEKRKLKSLGFNKKVFDYFIGAVLAVVLLVVIMFVCCVAGVMSFGGFTSVTDVLYLLALFAGFSIQGSAEELVCRGFLLPSLLKKTSLPVAVLVSSTAFALPHLPTVLEADPQFALIGVINLYLVSAVFSLLFILRSNIYIVCGLHSVWNFVLNGAMGLSVSGSNSNENSLLNFNVNAQNILSGGAYGVEASVVTAVLLGIAIVVLVKLCHKRGIKNGF